MPMYDIGLNDAPLTEDQKLDAAIATYRANGDASTANKLIALRNKKRQTKGKKTTRREHFPVGLALVAALGAGGIVLWSKR